MINILKLYTNHGVAAQKILSGVKNEIFDISNIDVVHPIVQEITSPWELCKIECNDVMSHIRC